MIEDPKEGAENASTNTDTADNAGSASSSPEGSGGKTAAEMRENPTEAQKAAIEDPQAGAGETRTTGEPFGDAVEATPTVISDPEGVVSNRVEGTIQREPTPEEMPADAKIAPVAEQVNPNNAGQAVGAAPTPEEIAGVEQPGEGEKNVLSDASDVEAYLPPDSEQVEDAQRAAEDAGRDADRGIAQTRT